MTYDYYAEQQTDNSSYCRSTYSLQQPASQKESEKPFKPLAPRVNKREWKAAKQRSGTDVTFKVLNQEFSAHKIKLMANSDYFNRMFSVPMTESLHPNGVIELKEVDPLIFKILLKFIYTGTMGKAIQENFVKDIGGLIQVMQKAEYFQIDGIVQWSSELVRAHLSKNKNVSCDIVKTLFNFALKANDRDLIEVLMQFLKDADSRYTDNTLIAAINQASVDHLITPKNWKILMDSCPGYYNNTLRTILENAAKYNPLIIEALAAKEE